MSGGGVAAFAPGRVNIVGEHTDYNEGLCLPFAVRAGVTVTARPLAGGEVHAVARDLGEEDRFAVGERDPGGGWRALVRGVAGELTASGVRVRPVRLELSAELPAGGGLGSSAAVCVAVALALSALAGEAEPDRVELARLCSRVENHWAGARTGLLDQLASLFGRDGHAVRMDMRTLELTAVPLELDGARFATLDSGAARELGGTGYNERRAECAAACEALGIGSLRDARPDDVERLPDPLARRARHVLTENERVDAMAPALLAGDLERAGRLLDASHRSLRDDYGASVPAVERAVDRARAAGALGARMLGGGFGGQVLALFGPAAPTPPGAAVAVPSGGARLL